MQLCERYPFEIISVDSTLVYKGFDIGAAKPSPKELEKYPHHLIDIRLPTQPYSASDFRNDATQIIKEIYRKNKVPLLVGGTMLYFKALQHGLNELPSADNALRQKLEQEANQLGWEKIHERLATIDPLSAKRIHPNDPQRIQRALEVYELTGKPLSSYFEDIKNQPEFEFINISLIPNERSWLHQRIEQRFIHMIEHGLIEETKHLLEKYDHQTELPAFRSVGYRQVIAFLNNEIDNNTLIEKGTAATRQLAKRQLTWLRHWENSYTVFCDDSSAMKNLLNSKFFHILS